MAAQFTQRFWYFLILIPTLCDGYGSGAPGDNNQAVCTTLTPGHTGTSTQTSPAPYAISISPAEYTVGGSPITVTLHKQCDTPFRGFLLLARYAQTSADENMRPGSFTTPEGSRKTCSAGSELTQAVTHMSTAAKDSLTFQWTPPASGNGGHIVFRATFLATKAQYWVDVHSELLVDSNLGQPSDTSDFVTPGSTTMAPCVTATTTKPGSTDATQPESPNTTGEGSSNSGGRIEAGLIQVWFCSVLVYVVAGLK